MMFHHQMPVFYCQLTAEGEISCSSSKPGVSSLHQRSSSSSSLHLTVDLIKYSRLHSGLIVLVMAESSGMKLTH